MKRVLIGKIATAHGVRGDVKVQCYLEDIELMFTPDGVYTSPNKPDKLVLTYKNMLNGDALVCSVGGIADRTAAERLRGLPLYLDEDALPALSEDDVYVRELEGMEAQTPEGKPLGTVLGLRNFGASDLLEIQGKKDSYFIPFCEPYFIRVEKEQRRIILLEPEVL